MAFPEVRQEILYIYSLGYGYKHLAKVLGFPRSTLHRWINKPPSTKMSAPVQSIKRDPKYIALRDEIMRELWKIREGSQEYMMGGGPGPKMIYSPTQITPYNEPYDPQEHDLDDEWEIEEPPW